MNHISKTVMLSGALALCAALLGCSDLAPPAAPAAEVDTSSAITGSVCDQFCQSQGGQFYLSNFATSESACLARGGDWYTADQGYPGPPPGCCCKCGLISGGCL